MEAVIQSADNNGKVNESLFQQALREGYSSVFINGKIADYLKSKGRSYQQHTAAAAASSAVAMDDNSSTSSGLPGDSPTSGPGTIAKATADYWKSHPLPACKDALHNCGSGIPIQFSFLRIRSRHGLPAFCEVLFRTIVTSAFLRQWPCWADKLVVCWKC